MAFEIRKAERRRARARVGLDGPAGAGKTNSALRLAKGLAPKGRIIVIDSENGSAELEAGKAGMPEFDVIQLGAPYSPKRYTEAIHACEEAGADVIIVDSLSHAWTGTGGALDQVDRAAGSGNRFTAWRDVTPQHNGLVDAILQSSAHVLVTMRTKMEYALEQNDKGKNVVKKLGMAPVQREGMEYEMTLVFDIEQERHYARATKDRTSLFDGQPPEILTEKHGVMLREWLETGAEPVPVAKPEVKPAKAQSNGHGAAQASPEDKRAAMIGAIQTLERDLDARSGAGTAFSLMQTAIGKGVTIQTLTDTELKSFGKALTAALDEAQPATAEA